MDAVQLQEWQVQTLARLGGFSYKMIAKRVWGSEEYASSVGPVLRKAGIRVRDWRDAKTREARQHANLILSPKSRKRSA